MPIMKAARGDVFLPIIFCFPFCPTRGVWSLLSNLSMGNHQSSYNHSFTYLHQQLVVTQKQAPLCFFLVIVFLIILFKTVFWCASCTSLANCFLFQSCLHLEIMLLLHTTFVFICLMLFRWFASVRCLYMSVLWLFPARALCKILKPLRSGFYPTM